MTQEPRLGAHGIGCVLCGYLERFAFARGAEEMQAFEIIAPLEVVVAVPVIVQLDGVVLPEPQPRAPVLKLHKLEAERVVLPWVVPGDTAPAQLAVLLEGGNFHDRVEVPGEGPVLLCTDLSFGRAQLGTPPTPQALCFGECGPYSSCGGVDVDDVMNTLHRLLASFRRVWGRFDAHTVPVEATTV